SPSMRSTSSSVSLSDLPPLPRDSLPGFDPLEPGLSRREPVSPSTSPPLRPRASRSPGDDEPLEDPEELLGFEPPCDDPPNPPCCERCGFCPPDWPLCGFVGGERCGC